MFRSVLFLILLLMATTALTGAQYGSHSARLLMQPEQALAADIDCMNHKLTEADSASKPDCDASKPCNSCKLCHVCPHAALFADAAPAAAIQAALYTRPTHSAAAWLSAEHAPDFKPPIL
ncbi:MAG: hypothetical protein V4772_13400 [Pseudomonadota bacterium]